MRVGAYQQGHIFFPGHGKEEWEEQRQNANIPK